MNKSHLVVQLVNPSKSFSFSAIAAIWSKSYQEMLSIWRGGQTEFLGNTASNGTTVLSVIDILMDTDKR